MPTRKPRSKPRPADVPIRLTLYLSRDQVRAGWGRSRVQLLRAVRGALFELTGDDGGRYSPRVVFDEERVPGIPGPARTLADDVATGFGNDDRLMEAALDQEDKLDGGLAEAEYQMALANLNAVRAENHLTGWSAHRLRRHLVTYHGVSPSELPYAEPRMTTLDERHRREHERMSATPPDEKPTEPAVTWQLDLDDAEELWSFLHHHRPGGYQHVHDALLEAIGRAKEMS